MMIRHWAKKKLSARINKTKSSPVDTVSCLNLEMSVSEILNPSTHHSIATGSKIPEGGAAIRGSWSPPQLNGRIGIPF